jgi:hypothetical protein
VVLGFTCMATKKLLRKYCVFPVGQL